MSQEAHGESANNSSCPSVCAFNYSSWARLQPDVSAASRLPTNCCVFYRTNLDIELSIFFHRFQFQVLAPLVEAVE